MASEKTIAIEHLYDTVFLLQGRSTVRLTDVVDSILFCNKHFGTGLSTKNPANFFKDFIRGENSSANWPKRLTTARMTARQLTGNSFAFEFIPFAKDQTEAFPERFPPSPEVVTIPIQTVTLNLAARELGRRDEPWLVQTIVNLRIVEQFLAVMSDIPFIEISHLQMSVKLSKAEIDSVFLGKYQAENGEMKYVYITCEAKQAKDRILHDQLIRQVESAFSVNPEIESVIPIAVKALRDRGIHIVEFQKLERETFFRDMGELELVMQKDAIFELFPSIKGIDIH
ncbi:MAG: hypothetical protein Marn2KO_17270 [Marinobacter nauticus]